jgi:hypothetical protein
MSISGPIFGSIHGERLLDELGEEYFCIPKIMRCQHPCHAILYNMTIVPSVIVRCPGLLLYS